MAKIAPTRGNMRRMKTAMALAVKGRELLDQKRKILMAELLSRIRDVETVQREMEKTFIDGYESLRMAHITMGIGNVERVAESVPIENGFVVRLRSVMGVEVPQVDPLSDEVSLPYSFGSTSPVFDDAYLHAKKVSDMISRIAEVETSVTRLALQIRKTARRVNALEKITIPFQLKTIKEISAILDESERDDMVRMKLSKKEREL